MTRISIAFFAASAAIFSGSAVADELALEEIVVSAYRPVTAFELDTSVTLLDSETIRSSTLNHFEELVQLNTLDLRYNQLTDISVLKELGGLHTLDLSSREAERNN